MRARVLQMGPDPASRGGMAASLRALLSSPLAERYRLDMAVTYGRAEPLPRLARFLGGLARLTAWSLARRGRVVHVHATVRGSAYRKSVCVLAARVLLRRVVLQVHSGAGDIAAFRAGRGRLSLALFAAAFRSADAVLAVSEASAGALREAGVERAIEVVPNPAPQVEAFERRPAEPAGAVRAAYLGGFANPAKGFDVLVEALRDLLPAAPSLDVVLAGPGRPDAEAERLIAGPRVEWRGWLDDAGRDRLLREAEIFVMPSRSEGLPMALLEAMAYGAAVVATRAGGIPELVEDGVDGVLVAPEDPASLAEALRRLAGNAPLRARLGAAARERVRRLDDVEVAGRLDALYSGLV